MAYEWSRFSALGFSLKNDGTSKSWTLEDGGDLALRRFSPPIFQALSLFAAVGEESEF